MNYSDAEDAPDCSELLEDFIGIAKDIAPGDTLILKLSCDCASIELLVNGYSIFKQERHLTEVPPTEGPKN